MLLFLFFLFLLWMVLWSFSSVIIHRLKTWEKGMFMWRSKCPNCDTQLGLKDLIPLFSYISTRGKCRYCKKKISLYYPTLELSLWIFFVAIWYFLGDFNAIVSGNIAWLFMMDFWLFIWFFAFIYTVYDILYLEIPENILWILVVWILVFLSIHTILPHLYNLPTLADTWWGLGLQNILSILVTFFSVAGLYAIMLGWLDEKYDVLIFLWIILWLLWVKYWLWIELSTYPMYSALIGTLCIFWFFFAQILVSKGKWMWAWDLRIAIVLGLVLWYSYWLPWLMITYLSWSIIGILVIANSKLIKKEKEFNGQIPFWPFLTIWLFVTLFYREEIDIFMKNYFLL